MMIGTFAGSLGRSLSTHLTHNDQTISSELGKKLCMQNMYDPYIFNHPFTEVRYRDHLGPVVIKHFSCSTQLSMEL